MCRNRKYKQYEYVTISNIKKIYNLFLVVKLGKMKAKILLTFFVQYKYYTSTSRQLQLFYLIMIIFIWLL